MAPHIIIMLEMALLFNLLLIYPVMLFGGELQGSICLLSTQHRGLGHMSPHLAFYVGAEDANSGCQV